MSDKQQITQSGKAELEEQLRQLIEVERPIYMEQLQFARSQGDLSENSDYDAAKARQAEVENRIAKIQKVLSEAIIIDDSSNSDIIGLSSLVRIRRLDNNKESLYQIVASIEAKPNEVKENGSVTISNISPLGKALTGHHVGEKVLVNSPKPYSVEILEIIKK